MKILLITTTYPTPTRPHQGAFNRVLVKALSTRHAMRVIAPIPWPQLLDNRSQSRGDAETLYPTYYYTPKLLRAHYHRFYWRSIRASLRQLKGTFVPDLVLGYWLHPDGAAAVRAAKHFAVPCIIMSGGSDLRLLPGEGRRGQIIRRVLADTDRLVVFSRELAGHAHRLGAAPSGVEVVYRGVDRNCFHPQDREQSRAALGLDRDAVVVFWAGRLTNIKNPHMLLHAAVQWHDRWGSRFRVIVAGDGPLRARLAGLAKHLKLEPVLRFVGQWTHQKLAIGYNAADVTVLTSHSEGIPNVLLESMACGTPFVATDVGGIAEIATAGLDRLVPPGNVDALFEAVVQQIQSRPTLRRSFVPDDLNGVASRFDAVFTHTLSTAQAAGKKAAAHSSPRAALANQPEPLQEPAL